MPQPSRAYTMLLLLVAAACGKSKFMIHRVLNNLNNIIRVVPVRFFVEPRALFFLLFGRCHWISISHSHIVTLSSEHRQMDDHFWDVCGTTFSVSVYDGRDNSTAIQTQPAIMRQRLSATQKYVHFSSFIDFEWISYDNRVYANRTPRKRIQMTFEPLHDGINGCIFRGDTVCHSQNDETIFDFASPIAGCLCVVVIAASARAKGITIKCNALIFEMWCDKDILISQCIDRRQHHRRIGCIPCVCLIHIHDVQKKYLFRGRNEETKQKKVASNSSHTATNCVLCFYISLIFRICSPETHM